MDWGLTCQDGTLCGLAQLRQRHGAGAQLHFAEQYPLLLYLSGVCRQEVAAQMTTSKSLEAVSQHSPPAGELYEGTCQQRKQEV